MRRSDASVIRPIHPRPRGHYRAGVLTLVRSRVRSVWHLPAPSDARPPGRADHVLVLLVALAAVVEVALLRPDMTSPWVALGAFLVWLPTLLVRRTRPLLVAATFAVAAAALTVLGWTMDFTTPDDVNVAVVALLIPYSLARWASGRDAVVGLGLFVLVAATSLLTQDLARADRIGGASVVIAAAATGAALRARSKLRTRELDDVRRSERERLARDLHDTVAHHLTAITITAQAGLAVAERQPGAATDALRRIAEEASRTLAETRKVLRMLRTEEEPAARPLDDLAGLTSQDGHGPRVEVHLADGLELSPTVAAAVHRIAQESVANARRHAVGATSVRVEVKMKLDLVEVTVTDDGRTATSSGQGFGITGMTERAELLGGRLTAGPATGGGWRVTALLPTWETR